MNYYRSSIQGYNVYNIFVCNKNFSRRNARNLWCLGETDAIKTISCRLKV